MYRAPVFQTHWLHHSAGKGMCLEWPPSNTAPTWGQRYLGITYLDGGCGRFPTERGPPSTQTEAKASLTQLLNAQRHALPFTLLLTCAYQEWLRSQLPCHSPQHHKRGTGWLRVSGVTPFWGTPSRLQLHPKGQGRKPRISSELERP